MPAIVSVQPGSIGSLFSVRWLKQALIICLSGISVDTYAQQDTESRLLLACSATTSDTARVLLLGQLSDYYYASKNYIKGDSVIEKQIMLAEGSLNKDLVLYAYFRNAGYMSTGASTKDRSQNTIIYVNRALEKARSLGLRDYMALAYSNLAALNNTDGNTGDAIKNANLGFTTALGTDNDSAKVICAIQLGTIYLQQSDILTAFKIFTNANNIAVQHPEQLLLPPVYHATALLYKKLGNDEVAKNYIFRSLALNKLREDKRWQVKDYIFLAKLTNYMAAKDYLQHAITLAGSAADHIQQREAQRILFMYMLLQEKPSTTLAYLGSQPELNNIFLNTGPDYLNWMMAEIYLYGGRPDSAIHYFRLAETSFNVGYDLTSKKNFFGEFAYCYQQLGNTTSAIAYFQKSVDFAKQASDLPTIKAYAKELKNLYLESGNYELAFHYSELYDHYKDTVDLLTKEKDVALMEIENVARQQQRDVEAENEKIRRKFNLQYMLITIIVVAAFVLMIMVGAFKVSTFMIRLMGFLSLIFFFEFVILILDKWIHNLTHGEPWKIWVIKICIISILLPFHHFLEHKLIRYLLSRHLITIRSRLSITNLYKKKKPPVPVREEEVVTPVDEKLS
jgi:tetratricopeptide (TPR) repeat protein